jgi:DNA-binding IclR family transcriptional regulator
VDPEIEMERPPTKSASWRLFQLIEAVVGANGLGVRETARATGIDKSTVSRMLTQLQDLGFVEQEPPSGKYRVGPRLFALGAAVVARDSMAVAARPMLERLANRFNETCYLAVREQDGFVYRAKIESTRMIRYVIELGYMGPLHAGAPGRAILSGLPEADLVATIERLNLEKLTDGTITDPKDLLRAVRDDRRRGYSFTIGERMRGGSAVAAPFFDSLGRCQGSMVVSRPAERHSGQDINAIAQAVVEAAWDMTARLGGTLGPGE